MLTVTELAERAGYNPESIRRLLRKSTILIGCKVGQQWRIEDAEAERFLDGIAARHVANTRPDLDARIRKMAAQGHDLQTISRALWGYKSGDTYARIKRVAPEAIGRGAVALQAERDALAVKRRERILKLAAAGLPRSRITRRVFGYTSGTAYQFVCDVLDNGA